MASETSELTFVRCPSCRSLVPATATRCRICNNPLEGSDGAAKTSDSEAAKAASRVRQKTITATPEDVASALKQTPQPPPAPVAPAPKPHSEPESADFDPLSAYLEELEEEELGGSTAAPAATPYTIEPPSSGVEPEDDLGFDFFSDVEPEPEPTPPVAAAAEVDLQDEFDVAEPVEIAPKEVVEVKPVAPVRESAPPAPTARREDTRREPPRPPAFQPQARREQPQQAAVSAKPEPAAVQQQQRANQEKGQDRRNRDGSQQQQQRRDQRETQQSRAQQQQPKPQQQQTQQQRGQQRTDERRADDKRSNEVSRRDERRQDGHREGGHRGGGQRDDVQRPSAPQPPGPVAEQVAPKTGKMRPGRLFGWFVSYENPDGRAIELREGKFFVTGSSIRPTDLILEDPSISTPHALMAVSADGGLVIQDLMSDRGVFVRGSDGGGYRREEGTVRVSHGDWIRFGDVEFLVIVVPQGAKR